MVRERANHFSIALPQSVAVPLSKPDSTGGGRFFA